MVSGIYNSGTVISTASGIISPNSTHYLEWDITFGPASGGSPNGSYQIWLDGASILSGSNVNTRAGSTNNYANQLYIEAHYYLGTYGAWTVDDLYLFDSTGSTCNSVLLNNPIVETSYPSGDVQQQWSASAAILGSDNSLTSSTNAPGANYLFLRTFVAPTNMTLNSISCVPATTNGVAKFLPAVYGPVTTPIGSHRYWRIVCYNAPGSNFGFCEIQFRTTVGVPLLFSGGTASASDVAYGAAANATDNNTATQWKSGSKSYGTWWQYDYGPSNTLSVAEISMTASSGSDSFNAPTIFELQSSDDGTTWAGVAAFYPSSWTSLQTQTFNVTSRPTIAGSSGSSLLSTGPEVVGCISGSTLTATLTSNPTLVAGTQYAIGFITDTSIALRESDTNTIGLKGPIPYGLPPNILVLLSSPNQSNWMIYGNCTSPSNNYTSVNLNPPIDDISYVSSSTPGQEDLYGFPMLTATPDTITCIAYKARVKRSDSGIRTVDVRCVSGTTDSSGTAAGFTPGSSYQWVDTYFPIDPNTGMPWTGSGANAAAAGVKVAS